MPAVAKKIEITYDFESEKELPALTLEAAGVSKPTMVDYSYTHFSSEFLAMKPYVLAEMPIQDEVEWTPFEGSVSPADKMDGWFQRVKKHPTDFESRPGKVQPKWTPGGDVTVPAMSAAVKEVAPQGGKSTPTITLEPCVRCGALLEAEKGHICPRAPKTDELVRTQIESSAKFVSEVTRKREVLARAEALGQLTSILARWPTSKIVQLTGIAMILNVTPQTTTVGPPCSSVRLPSVPSLVSPPIPSKFPIKCQICKCVTLDNPTNWTRHMQKHKRKGDSDEDGSVDHKKSRAEQKESEK